jgi:hypothetical protein
MADNLVLDLCCILASPHVTRLCAAPALSANLAGPTKKTAACAWSKRQAHSAVVHARRAPQTRAECQRGVLILSVAHLGAAHRPCTAPSRPPPVRAQVFRPSHTLPTITVEQAGEMEYQQMVAREAASARQQAEEKAADNALPAEDREERELHKVRAMDDFKDANPRGWGNSKLRPCG